MSGAPNTPIPHAIQLSYIHHPNGVDKPKIGSIKEEENESYFDKEE
jgi:hypothetical protein